MHTRFLSLAAIGGLLLVVLTACTSSVSENPPKGSSSSRSQTSSTVDSFASMAAREALADRLNVDASSIVVVNSMEQEWSDSCLGLGGPAESCAAVMTPGYEIVLAHGETEYIYRTNYDGSIVREEE